MTYNSEVLADSPILYLKMDEASGTPADSSTAARAITATGSPTLNVSGVSNKGISFDGVDDILSAASVADFGGATGYTLEVWFKSTQSTNFPTFFRRDGNGTVLLRLQNGKVEFRANNGTVALTPLATYADGNWHHVVGVKSGTTATLYVDGVSVATGSASTLAQTTTPATYIGGGGVGAELLNGTLDEAAIYSTALSAARITAHYNEGVAALAAANNPVSVAPAMTMSLTAPTPVVTAVDITLQTLAATADRRIGSDVGNEASAMLANNAGSYYDLVFKFATPNIPVGYIATGAVLTLTRYDDNTNAVPIRVAVPNGTWTESTTGSIPYTEVSTGLNIPTGSANTSFDIDVTDAYNAGGADRGIVVGGADTVSDGLTLWMRESSTAAYRPTLTVTLAEQPQVPAVIQAPVMTLDLLMPQHRFAVDTKSIVVGAVSMSLSAPDVTTTVTGSLVMSATPIVMDASFAGGRSVNPDFTATTGAIEMYLASPDAMQYVGVDKVVAVAGTMDFVVDGTSDTQINLQTDRTIFVQAMTMNIKTYGGYREGVEDRYRTYVSSTVDADDIWLKLSEVAGTVAVDAITGGVTTLQDDAIYMGDPLLGEGGYRGRKAVGFDGVDDYLLMTTHYPAGAFPDMDATLEFSIKTTDLNGTIIRGGGNVVSTSPSPAYAGTYDSEVRLINGELALYTGSGGNIIYRTRKFVADGEWHHVVISLPSATARIFDAFHISASNPFFVNVDGETVWTRYAPPLYGRSFLPASVMARAVFTAANSGDIDDPENYSASEHVAGSLSDVVVRYHYAVGRSAAEKLYYEWSESLLVNPEPITLSLTAPDPHSAKGNTKRMIALYGLPHYLYANDTVPYTRDGFGTYYSVFAGYYIENDGFYVPTGPGGSAQKVNYHSNPTRMMFQSVKPFRLEDYMVYPVAVAATPGSNGGAFSAPGMENGEYRDPITHEYIDDRTGLPRFVDLDEDLVEDITEFDAITAVNYPAVLPWDGGNTQNDPLQEFRQHNLGLTNNEWQTARDRLRDSILNAAYRGVNLWIPEPHMAEHLGFIQAYDKHTPGDKFEFFGSGGIDPTGYTNDRAHQIDRAHLVPTTPDQWVNGKGVGQFAFTWQANSKRVIVSTEAGLTNLPGWEKTDQIRYYSDNAWQPHSQVLAYDAIDRMAGLQIGDQVLMHMSEAGSYTGNYPPFNGWSVGDPRQFIVSAKPEGIVGKPISKELDFFYGAYGAIVPNVYRDNVYTIAAERGSVVRGRPIAGRAFMEFMDADINTVKIPIDANPDHWNGEPDKNVTSWSFDSRRYKEIIILWIIQKNVSRGDAIVTLNDEQRYIDIQDRDWIYKPFISMNARGLNWLSEADDLPAGDAKAYVPSMDLSLETTGATVVKTRNVTSTVIGAMRLDLELVEPASVDNPDVSVKALPITLSLEMRGIGKAIKAETIVLTLTAPDSVVTGSGDRITVYMDAVRDITLFMKED